MDKNLRFSNTLKMWYLINRRSLPWRGSKNPYLIWLSEIILQQTRIAQGTAYYQRFVENFPTVFDLAKAEENEVLLLWKGLGYYSRARNLHSSARQIVNDRNGVFPSSYKDLLNLKGVGDYTASAISSICFDEAQATVDGNVFRVLSRVFGIDTDIASTAGIRQFKDLAQQLLDEKDPGTHNQAVMEFGALVCTPIKPSCDNCELQSICYAYEHNIVTSLPVKVKKTKIRKRYFHYFVIQTPEDQTMLQIRSKKDIWEQLYEFPLLETDGEELDNESMEAFLDDRFKNYFPVHVQQANSRPIIHKLSHQHIHTWFWIVRTEKNDPLLTKWSDFDRIGVPILIQNFVDNYKMA